MDELQPGLLDWAAFHEGIGQEVHSHFHAPSGTLIDPKLPPGGLDALERAGRPQRIVLTSRHHYRDGDAIREAFGCPVLCHEAGLHQFEGGPVVEGYAFGDELAPGVRALEVGVLTPEETALHISVWNSVSSQTRRRPAGDPRSRRNAARRPSPPARAR